MTAMPDIKATQACLVAEDMLKLFYSKSNTPQYPDIFLFLAQRRACEVLVVAETTPIVKYSGCSSVYRSKINRSTGQNSSEVFRMTNQFAVASKALRVAKDVITLSFCISLRQHREDIEHMKY